MSLGTRLLVAPFLFGFSPGSEPPNSATETIDGISAIRRRRRRSAVRNRPCPSPKTPRTRGIFTTGARTQRAVSAPPDSMAERVGFELSVLFGECGASPNRVAWQREIEVQGRVAKPDSDARIEHLFVHLFVHRENDSMTATKVSVAEARQHFARLIKRAQQGKTIEITRRGQPVAVLISASEYSAITGERPSFIYAMSQVRERLGVEALGIGDAEFEGLREESPGREISL